MDPRRLRDSGQEWVDELAKFWSSVPAKKSDFVRLEDMDGQNLSGTANLSDRRKRLYRVQINKQKK